MNNAANGRFSNEKQRPGLHNNAPNRWGSDARALPTHSVWIQGSDEKSMMNRGRSIFARTRRTVLDLRKYLSRYWTVQQRRSRASILGSKAPLTSPGAGAGTLRFILLCALWYTSSALSSNTGKAILTHFRYPITLTFVQFGFVAFYCVLLMSPAMPMRLSEIRPPTRKVVETTLPMGMFQVGGHVFSSIAISRIPVSTVHTIKALSPLFTVAAYALLFGVSYSPRTYFSLLPLTFGVMLACSFDVSASNITGLLCAFGSALVFVSSNIFFKKIMPSNGGGASAAHKLDKLNLLLYSSSMAFLLMVPIWTYYDLPLLLSTTHPSHTTTHASTHAHSLPFYFFLNGTVHFLQNILAFVLLSSTSPVTYSIASLIKRVAVICIAIVWFAQTIHPLQGCGIVLTFVGLYLYNNAKGDVEQGEKQMRRVERERGGMLPSTKSEAWLPAAAEAPPIMVTETAETTGMGMDRESTVYGRPRAPSSGGHTHHHGHVHPPLSIMITPPSGHGRHMRSASGKEGLGSVQIVSPLDSYPSPPPSVDSPPSFNAPLPAPGHGYEFAGMETQAPVIAV